MLTLNDTVAIGRDDATSIAYALAGSSWLAEKAGSLVVAADQAAIASRLWTVLGSSKLATSNEHRARLLRAMAGKGKA